MKEKAKPTLKNDGYEMHFGYRIRVIQAKAGKRYQVDLGRKSGKHVRRVFPVLQEARNWAYSKSIEADNKGISALLFSDEQKTDAIEARALLKGYNVNLRAAAAFYIRHHQAVDLNNGTSHLIQEYIAEQAQRVEDETLRPATYADTIKRLKPLKNQLGHMAIDAIQSNDIAEMLRGYKPQNAANYKRYTSMFFRWAMRQGKVQGNPVELLDQIKLNDDAPEIYEPAQVKALFKCCTEGNDPRRELLPYFALAFFGGIRPEEIRRLEWKDVNLEEGIIHIRADVAKTKKARFLDMPENLIQWLAICDSSTDLVFPRSESSLKRWRAAAYQEADIPSIQDGARHSMATYYLALHTIEETTELLGHADKVLFRHYKGLVKGRKTKAKAYFGIKPGKAKVIQFQQTGSD